MRLIAVQRLLLGDMISSLEAGLHPERLTNPEARGKSLLLSLYEGNFEGKEATDLKDGM